MLLLLEAMKFFYVYPESNWKYHTFEGYNICSFSKLRHNALQRVCKCSLTFPLQSCIVTCYENWTNAYVRVNKRYTLPGCLGYIRYNFLIAWAIITIYTFKCAQMDLKQLPNRSKFYSRCKSVISLKT